MLHRRTESVKESGQATRRRDPHTEQRRAVGASIRGDVQQHLAAGDGSAEHRAQQRQAVMQHLRAIAQVEQEAEAAQHERHALQVAQRARQFPLCELQDEGDQQHHRNARDAEAVAEADEAGHG